MCSCSFEFSQTDESTPPCSNIFLCSDCLVVCNPSLATGSPESSPTPHACQSRFPFHRPLKSWQEIGENPQKRYTSIPFLQDQPRISNCSPTERWREFAGFFPYSSCLPEPFSYLSPFEKLDRNRKKPSIALHKYSLASRPTENLQLFTDGKVERIRGDYREKLSGSPENLRVIDGVTAP